MAQVPFVELKRVFELHKDEYEEAVLKALRSGWYILGNEVVCFEREFAEYLGAKHCIGVGCGQDALTLAIRALNIGAGDEVIVAGNTYIATVLGVTENGAIPVFVDCDEYFELDTNQIENAVTANTKAVLTTNLYGQCCQLEAIREFCDEHGLYMLEDCAQSHGASIHGLQSGTVGDIGCFSFYPTKPLGAFGDGGACVTSNDAIGERLRMLRNYGSRVKYVNEIPGVNSRLDEIQAAALRVGLRYLDESNETRRRIAQRYLAEIRNPEVLLPMAYEGSYSVYHIFPVLCENREQLQQHMISKGVQTQIHYPIPPHQAECYKVFGFDGVRLPNTENFAVHELSLPIYCGMSDDDVAAVIDAVNSFKVGL